MTDLLWDTQRNFVATDDFETASSVIVRHPPVGAQSVVVSIEHRRGAAVQRVSSLPSGLTRLTARSVDADGQQPDDSISREPPLRSTSVGARTVDPDDSASVVSATARQFPHG